MRNKLDYIGFVQSGTMYKYREKLSGIGTEMRFEKGTDVLSFLIKNDLVFYLESGMLYFRLCKPDGLYIQLMAYKQGTVLPMFRLNETLPYREIQMLVAARGEVSGFVFPRSQYRYLRRTDSEFAGLVDQQVMNAVSYLYVSQLLYRDGECITRISNLLCHVHLYEEYEPNVLPIGQEELACTINSSISQVKRALSKLKREGAIELKYEKIEIKDFSVIKKYISDSMYIEELADKENEDGRSA